MIPNLTAATPTLVPYHDGRLRLQTSKELRENETTESEDGDDVIQEFMNDFARRLGKSGIQSFYEHKTIEQIVEEQGLKPVRLEDLYPQEPIWKSQEDFDNFWNINDR